jgi:hypothetical protein
MPRKQHILPRIVEQFDHGRKRITIEATKANVFFAHVFNPDGTKDQVLGPLFNLGEMRVLAVAWVEGVTSDQVEMSRRLGAAWQREELTQPIAASFPPI